MTINQGINPDTLLNTVSALLEKIENHPARSCLNEADLALIETVAYKLQTINLFGPLTQDVEVLTEAGITLTALQNQLEEKNLNPGFGWS